MDKKGKQKDKDIEDYSKFIKQDIDITVQDSLHETAEKLNLNSEDLKGISEFESDTSLEDLSGLASLQSLVRQSLNSVYNALTPNQRILPKSVLAPEYRNAQWVMVEEITFLESQNEILKSLLKRRCKEKQKRNGKSDPRIAELIELCAPCEENQNDDDPEDAQIAELKALMTLHSATKKTNIEHESTERMGFTKDDRFHMRSLQKLLDEKDLEIERRDALLRVKREKIRTLKAERKVRSNNATRSSTIDRMMALSAFGNTPRSSVKEDDVSGKSETEILEQLRTQVHVDPLVQRTHRIEMIFVGAVMYFLGILSGVAISLSWPQMETLVEYWRVSDDDATGPQQAAYFDPVLANKIANILLGLFEAYLCYHAMLVFREL